MKKIEDIYRAEPIIGRCINIFWLSSKSQEEIVKIWVADLGSCRTKENLSTKLAIFVSMIGKKSGHQSMPMPIVDFKYTGLSISSCNEQRIESHLKEFFCNRCLDSDSEAKVICSKSTTNKPWSNFLRN